MKQYKLPIVLLSLLATTGCITTDPMGFLPPAFQLLVSNDARKDTGPISVDELLTRARGEPVAKPQGAIEPLVVTSDGGPFDTDNKARMEAYGDILLANKLYAATVLFGVSGASGNPQMIFASINRGREAKRILDDKGLSVSVKLEPNLPVNDIEIQPVEKSALRVLPNAGA